jgi:beta-lactam-binding protein with PASTA domain
MRGLLRIHLVAAAFCVVAAPGWAQQLDSTVAVPQLIGRTPAEAREILSRRGLTLASVDTTTSSGATPGRIIDQKPAADTKVRLGSRVAVVVGAGRPGPPKLVPSVIGAPVARALQRLAEAGLKPGSTSERDVFDQAAGIVIEQKPRGGDPAPASGTVDLVVVSAYTQVPSVVQRTLAAAERMLREKQLRLGRVSRSDAVSLPAGIIADQMPRAEQRVQRNSAVDVVIATDSTTVPQLMGRTINETQALLRRSFLSPGPIDTVANDAVAGTVLRQTPAAQTRVPKGSNVGLTIAAQIPTIVPDLRGLTRDSALAALQLRSLAPGTMTTEPAGGTPDRVIRQSRAPRSVVPSGTPVNLVFSLAQQPTPPPPAPVETAQALPARPTAPPDDSAGFPWRIVLGGAGLLAIALIGIALRTKARLPDAPPPPASVKPPIKPEAAAGTTLTYQPVQDAGTTELQPAGELTNGLALEFVAEPDQPPPDIDLEYATDLVEGADRG